MLCYGRTFSAEQISYLLLSQPYSLILQTDFKLNG